MSTAAAWVTSSSTQPPAATPAAAAAAVADYLPAHKHPLPAVQPLINWLLLMSVLLLLHQLLQVAALSPDLASSSSSTLRAAAEVTQIALAPGGAQQLAAGYSDGTVSRAIAAAAIAVMHATARNATYWPWVSLHSAQLHVHVLLVCLLLWLCCCWWCDVTLTLLLLLLQCAVAFCACLCVCVDLSAANAGAHLGHTLTHLPGHTFRTLRCVV